METEETSTLNRILRAAEVEFSEKGYQSASLRSIVKAAGVTTGAFYGYFKSKDQLLDALVGEAYETILTMYRQVLTNFQSLPADQQQEDMQAYTHREVMGMTDYVYDHLPAFRLMLCAAEGTRYGNLIGDMADLDVEATHRFHKAMEDLGVPVKPVNLQLEHMLTSGMFSAYFELVIHEIPRQEADSYISQLLDFYSAGWQKIMGY